MPVWNVLCNAVHNEINLDDHAKHFPGKLHANLLFPSQCCSRARDGIGIFVAATNLQQASRLPSQYIFIDYSRRDIRDQRHLQGENRSSVPGFRCIYKCAWRVVTSKCEKNVICSTYISQHHTLSNMALAALGFAVLGISLQVSSGFGTGKSLKTCGELQEQGYMFKFVENHTTVCAAARFDASQTDKACFVNDSP